MRYQLSQFVPGIDSNKLIQEASTLGVSNVIGRLPSGNRGIIIVDDKGNDLEFVFTHTDGDTEDVFGWHFRPTISTVRKHPEFANKRVLIIND